MRTKNIIIALLLFMLSAPAFSGSLDVNPRNHIEIKVNDLLLDQGFEQEMINDLFGDEYFYFPKSEEDLDLSYYIVDKIIQNGQYNDSDKEQLVNLAISAFELYNQDNLKSSPNEVE